MLFTREENLTKKNQRFLNILILSIPLLILTSCGTNSETSNIDLPELKKVDFNGSLPDKNKTSLNYIDLIPVVNINEDQFFRVIKDNQGIVVSKSGITYTVYFKDFKSIDDVN